MTTRNRNYEFTAREIARHKCLDCGRNVIKLGDYCMIDSEIWEKQLGLGWNDNMCIECVETRLGRELTPEEVSWGLAPGIEGFSKSDLLLTRAGHGEAVRKRRAKAKKKKGGKS